MSLEYWVQRVKLHTKQNETGLKLICVQAVYIDIFSVTCTIIKIKNKIV